MDDKAFREFIQRNKWTFAKTYAAFCPHEYVARDRLPPEERPLFPEIARLIRKEGFTAEYGRLGPNRYYVVDDRYYWTLDENPEDTVLINRAKLSDFAFVREGDKLTVKRKKPEAEQTQAPKRPG